MAGESPEALAALDVLVETWGDEPWLIGLFVTRDDGGEILCVQVDAGSYPFADPLPRKLAGCYVVVVKV